VLAAYYHGLALNGSLGASAILAQLSPDQTITSSARLGEGLAPGTWCMVPGGRGALLSGVPAAVPVVASRGLNGREQAIALIGICTAILAWRWYPGVPADAPKDRTLRGRATRASFDQGRLRAGGLDNPVLDKQGRATARSACSGSRSGG